MAGPDKIFEIALTQVPNIGNVAAKALMGIFERAEDIFTCPEGKLEKIEGIGQVRARSIKKFRDFSLAEAEMKFTERYGIRVLGIRDADYPKRLLHCYDSPTVLFYNGTADLNASRIISIVGTRDNTAYGKNAAETFVADLAAENITIVSGMAFGIDTIAHKASLKNQLPTIGVLAHGFKTIYPPENASLARQVVKNGGGLLTELFSEVKPDKHHFPSRNRIVAGMADATIVIETDLKGGSMITAELANGYNRDVFALPGRVTDPKSNGCNQLIRQNKAILLGTARDMMEAMNWMPKPDQQQRVQRQLFIELTADEKILTALMADTGQLPIDELYLKSGLSSSKVAAALLNLEMQGVLHSLPGKIYKLA